ncbi:Mrp/NBP35 family ATP-binding protein [Hoeflea prorocentri]|uniref:Iron-sulfur cluster carrier protein n=1 Tax=Hoeflea prorocentri TaxID=1922333 RepID=A0A9X3ULF3_9HYPH|nr:Mrp/NBP35 family ATP-binding protein [Hoeflea prorocentri]MCY6381364.1 Mrp/NBP35 family ATP-binding protein [Hoeflea prorocentri]MDA5399164.1 Mrp/NBP35 family ATP-binding protein [Hoeflea prorocentri]
MSNVSKEQVLKRLESVSHPAIGGNIVEKGLVSDVFVADGKVYFSITVAAEMAQKLEPLRQAAEQSVKTMDGVKSAMVALTAEKKPGSAPQPASAPPPAAAQAQPPQKAGVPGVGAIIAVASGKGGVGKSTTSVNLALGLQATGLKVGLLDADIYGPSIPRLLKVGGQPEQTGERLLKPKEAYGLKVMSMGFLVAEETPMIWRGPMVVSALTQMLREVAWGELDVIVVDMPPGTGDAQLTMAQKVPLAGAVIVSTPQDLALIDARKGLNMFKKVDVPLLGLIENMSYFQCPSCGTRSDIFGHGGARDEAARIGVPFLGEVPLHMSIREQSDAGKPVVVSEPDGPHAKIYVEIASKIHTVLSSAGSGEDTAQPRIVFE